jgi:hypothetical protein
MSNAPGNAVRPLNIPHDHGNVHRTYFCIRALLYTGKKGKADPHISLPALTGGWEDLAL